MTPDIMKISERAIVLPDAETAYMSVDLSDGRLKLCLLQAGDYVVSLDSKILPHLVDALIELQNRE
jgi:hypothetical protein